MVQIRPLRHLPRRLFLLLPTVLLSACAGGPGVVSPSPDLTALVEGGGAARAAAPSAQGARLADDGVLYLEYREAGELHRAEARIVAPGPALPSVSVGMAPAGPPIVALSPAGRTAPLAASPVPIRHLGDWQALLQLLVGEAVGLVPGRGVVLDVLQRQEWFLYRDAHGAVQVVPLTEKPPGTEPGLTLSLSDLLNGAQARIRRQVPGARALLFDSGDPDYPFVVMLLDQERTLFLARLNGQASAVPGTQLPAQTAQAAYHAVTSQVRSLATRPFSTLLRLLSGIGSGAIDALPRLGRWDGAGPPPPLAPAAAPMDPAAWERELDSLVGDSPTHGRIDYLVDGSAFFPALINAIGKARSDIRIRLYIFDNDDYAVRIADLLKARSDDVSVRILLDGLGTITGGMARPETGPQATTGPVSIADYLRGGSQVRVRVLPNPWMQGDHSKVLIFDGHRAFLGGMNIGREYRYEWHDLMVSLEGPVVDRLRQDFDEAWTRAGIFGELGALFRKVAPQVAPPGPGDYPLRLLYTRPGDSQILRAQLAALRSARQRVWIQNAYLTSDVILDGLIAARRRGVDVRVILPYRTDAGFIGRSNVLAANLMLRHGIRVFIYPGMSHVKAAVYDGWACLGSANFDRLSLRLNREVNIATGDPDAVGRLVEQVFETDFARAVELREGLPERWLDRLKELIADQL